MKIVKENKVQEAVKPMNFVVQFEPTTKQRDKFSRGVYNVLIDGHKMGILDEDNIEKFIKLKLEFVKKFERLLV